VFWDCVNEKLGKCYYAGLCEKNIGAITHLLRNGFEKVNEVFDNGKKFVILTKICNN
jgi:hypothetical protein